MLKILISLSVLIIGIVIGGYLFSNTQPRSFLSIQKCNHCLSSSELLGLVASVGIQKTPGLIPSIIKETDRTVVIESPVPQDKTDYLVLPKKDIKDLGDISPEDTGYVTDMIEVISSLIQEKRLKNYRVVSNGPSTQQINYLHFHILAD